MSQFLIAMFIKCYVVFALLVWVYLYDKKCLEILPIFHSYQEIFLEKMFVFLGYPPMAQFAVKGANTNGLVELFLQKKLY